MNIEIFKNKDGDQRISSLHLAELVDKRHGKVLRVIRRLADRGAIKSKPLVRIDERGKKQPYFELDLAETVNVAARTKPMLIVRLLDQWLEPERHMRALEIEAKNKQIKLATE